MGCFRKLTRHKVFWGLGLGHERHTLEPQLGGLPVNAKLRVGGGFANQSAAQLQLRLRQRLTRRQNGSEMRRHEFLRFVVRYAKQRERSR